MDTRTLFSEACAAAPLTPEGTQALEQARTEAEAPLHAARAVASAAAEHQAHLVATQFKINLALEKLNSEMRSIQPVTAKGVIKVVDDANVKADLVSALRACVKRKQELGESVSALNYALDFLVTRELPEAAVKACEAALAYADAKRGWIVSDALCRLHATRVAFSEVLKQDPAAVLDMGPDSLCSRFVQKLTELDVECGELAQRREVLITHARATNGGSNVQ